MGERTKMILVALLFGVGVFLMTGVGPVLMINHMTTKAILAGALGVALSSLAGVIVLYQLVYGKPPELEVRPKVGPDEVHWSRIEEENE